MVHNGTHTGTGRVQVLKNAHSIVNHALRRISENATFSKFRVVKNTHQKDASAR